MASETTNKRPKKGQGYHFSGFAEPRYTQVPDVVFDELLPNLEEAELRVLLYIIRRTFGFKKDADAISFNQFINGIRRSSGDALDHGCGISSRTTLSNALKNLESKGIISSTKGVTRDGENTTTIYGLHFKDSADEVVRRTYHRSTLIDAEVVRQLDPQETVLQETEKSTTPLFSIGDLTHLRRKILAVGIELADRTPEASTERVVNMWRQSRLPGEDFAEKMDEARIAARGKNMAHFFAVLEERLRA